MYAIQKVQPRGNNDVQCWLKKSMKKKLSPIKELVILEMVDLVGYSRSLAVGTILLVEQDTNGQQR